MAAKLNVKPTEPRSSAPQPSAPSRPSEATQKVAAPTLLEVILELEGQARAIRSVDELKFFAANNLRPMTGARQTFVVRLKDGDGPRVLAVSSVAAIDRQSPLIRWVETLSKRFVEAEGSDKQKTFRLPAYADPAASETAQYPFRDVLWQPLTLTDGAAFAAIIQTRERPFSDTDLKATARLADTIGHAWRALSGEKALGPRPAWRRWLWPAVAVAIIAAGALPVPLTTIAPMQVVPSKPFVVAAPLDGVIDRIEVPANTSVAKGDALVQFDATTLRNRAALAEQQLSVAAETYKKHQQQAFFEDKARYQLAISRAERDLKAAELEYARDLLAKTRITAPVAGVAIYGDRQKLEGHPVSTGQTIMRIADPARVEVEIDLPVSDAIVLRNGATVRVFLDRDPLNVIEARIVKGSYEATPLPSGQLVYKLRAAFKPDDTPPARIGARGTAQIFGETTSLAFFLFRRPLAALRQRLGV
jgi:multidrug efflux pump subunit AcrA (membrane-fusion protein)